MPEQLLDTLWLVTHRSHTRTHRLPQRHQCVYCNATLILSAVGVSTLAPFAEPFFPLESSVQRLPTQGCHYNLHLFLSGVSCQYAAHKASFTHSVLGPIVHPDTAKATQVIVCVTPVLLNREDSSHRSGGRKYQIIPKEKAWKENPQTPPSVLQP